MSAWMPLESNPEVLTKYIHKLGVSKNWAINDVLGLDPEMLECIPKPVKSIILLFPCSETYEKHRIEENKCLETEPQTYPKDLFFMRQFTHNSCGTVALLHSIANNKDIILEEGPLRNFLNLIKDMTPEERGKALENHDGVSQIHHELAQEGQTAVANPTEKVDHHFIALIRKADTLYELDGRKKFPIKHGKTSEDTYIHDAADVCKEFMARDPKELRFTVLALTGIEESVSFNTN